MNLFLLLKNKIFIAGIITLTALTVGYLYSTPKKEEKPVELHPFPHHIPKSKQFGEEVRNGVPLVIYESWQSHDLPLGMHDNIYTMLEKNPEFDFYLFSDDDCIKFIKDNFDEDVVDAFNTLRPGAFKSDLWRYCVLYKKGGIYMDIKYYSTVPLINIIDENQTIFVRDSGAPRTENGCFYNGFMASPPNNEIFKDCIDDIVKSCKKQLYRSGVLDITGPCLLGRILGKKYTSDYYKMVKFEYSNINGDFWNYYSGISYKGDIILKHYESYRNEQRKSGKDMHYGKLYAKGLVYNSLARLANEKDSAGLNITDL